MLKKLVLITLLLAALFGLAGFAQPKALAQADLSDEALAQADLSDEALAQAEDIKSTEFMFDLGVITHEDVQEQNWIQKGVNFLFERAITIMASIVGSVAVLVMVVGGFMMLASAGRQDMYDKGKSLILKAVIGLVFVLGAYILVTSIQLLIRSIYGS